MKLCLPAVVLVALWGASASAAEIVLTIAGGRVTLVARDASVRDILAAWAETGGTEVVGADALTAIVSLELRDVPEAAALKTVLRSAAGYVAAPRRVESRSASQFDRIFVMASSPTPRDTAPPPPREPPTFTWMPTPTQVDDLVGEFQRSALSSPPEMMEGLRELQRLLEGVTPEAGAPATGR